MKVTTKNIEKAILKATGLPIQLIKGKGYFYFVCDADDDVQVALEESQEASIYVYTLTQTDSVEWWVNRVPITQEDVDRVKAEREEGAQWRNSKFRILRSE